MMSIKENFVAQSRSLDEAKQGSVHKNNRAMDALMEIYRTFYRNPDAAAPILAELLAHPHAWVRLGAAVQSLGLSLHTAQAEQILIDLAKADEDKQLAFEAEICLAQWHKGELLKGVN